jgi:hypothetical protein
MAYPSRNQKVKNFVCQRNECAEEDGEVGFTKWIRQACEST